VYAALRDLSSAGVSIVAIGQYLRPSTRQLAVARYWEPGAFEEIEEAARAMGFSGVACAPYVRSSFRAGSIYRRALSARAELAAS
jgi:lipoic acid synthetase